MSKKLMTGAIALAVAAATIVGCADDPTSVRRVDPSVLPASVKGMFSQDAQITTVEEVTYTKGVREYRIHYTIDGKKKVIHVSDADETTPTGVLTHEMG